MQIYNIIMVYTTIRITEETWQMINSERKLNDTLDDAIVRVFRDRNKYKRIVMENSGAVTDA